MSEYFFFWERERMRDANKVGQKEVEFIVVELAWKDERKQKDHPKSRLLDKDHFVWSVEERKQFSCRIPAHFSLLLFFYIWLDSSSLVSSQIDGRKGIGRLFIVWELLWNSSVIDERQFECLIGLNNDFYPPFFWGGGGGGVNCCEFC